MRGKGNSSGSGQEIADGVDRRDLPRRASGPWVEELRLMVPTFIFLLLQRAQASCERRRRRGSAGVDGSPFSAFLRFLPCEGEG